MKWFSKLRRPGPLDVYFGGLSDDELSNAERVFFGALQLSNGTIRASERVVRDGRIVGRSQTRRMSALATG